MDHQLYGHNCLGLNNQSRVQIHSRSYILLVQLLRL